VDVVVPAGASLTVNGRASRQQGTRRAFETLPIPSDRTVTRTFVATWTQDGKEVRRSRTVTLRSGQRVTIDLTKEPSGKDQVGPERIEKVDE
jgi:uncharacterized protein (TIGR03000 family)